MDRSTLVNEKSRLRHGCVFGWFGVGLGTWFGPGFCVHFPSKIEKMASESIQENPNGAKSRKKGHLEMDAKNDAEKESKMMPKGFQNDAKMDAKIDGKTM